MNQMVHRPPVLLFIFMGACASGEMRTRPGPEAVIPCFAADDARVSTAGFVAQTLRLNKDADGVRYTLMAFAVGDQLTLGAMVKGAFRGTVHWRVGERELTVPFDTAAPGTEAAVTVNGAPDQHFRAKGAAFRGTAWTNVELPLAAWLSPGTALQLEFTPASGTPQVLPEPGLHYVARLERK